ncbi:MAG TPA: hypothetical protein VMN58_04955 [Acidimicrobiales bacterium]|nr:hypothetical protein [Acidimicrobiales bacterium]
MERSCRRCGATGEAPDDGLPTGWAMSSEGGRTTFLCMRCTRANLRDIEARLSEEWWEAHGS